MGIKKFIKNAIGVLIVRYVIGSGKEGWLVTRKSGTQQVIKVYSRQAYENNILPRIYGAKEDNWISCSERLPEEHILENGKVDPSDEVLVYIYYGENCASNGFGVSRYWKHNEILKNPWIDLTYGKNNVVAWRPLPPAYKVGE